MNALPADLGTTRFNPMNGSFSINMTTSSTAESQRIMAYLQQVFGVDSPDAFLRRHGDMVLPNKYYTAVKFHHDFARLRKLSICSSLDLIYEHLGGDRTRVTYTRVVRICLPVHVY